MRELSIFVDESGDIGSESDFYLVGLVFHDQDDSIEEDIARYEYVLREKTLDVVPFHFNPLLNGHDGYECETLEQRKRQLAAFGIFVQHLPFRYVSFFFDKRMQARGKDGIARVIEREMTGYLRGKLAYLQSFDRVKVYYDNGQSAVTAAVHGSIEHVTSRSAVVFRDASPEKYRLSQVADYVCGIELTAEKYRRGKGAQTDFVFFGEKGSFTKNYLRKLRRKRL